MDPETEKNKIRLSSGYYIIHFANSVWIESSKAKLPRGVYWIKSGKFRYSNSDIPISAKSQFELYCRSL